MEKNITFSFGTQCRQQGEKLSEIDIDELIDKIRNDEGLKNQIKLLRTIRNIDKERYRHMKTQLPYFSCSHFDQGMRGFDHFVYANSWVIDIDGDTPAMSSMIQSIASDPRVFIKFVSPSGYGVKLVFLFDKPCFDRSVYTRAYKTFAQELAVRYSLIDYIDMKNTDVSRICFLSHDPDVLLNPLAETIDLANYISPQLPSIIKDPKTEQNNADINTDTYKLILERLGTKPKIIKADPYTPDLLLAVVNPLIEMLSANQIMVSTYEKVQYGVKFKATMGADQGEVIIYLGKKGWTVVTGARKGLHHPLNEVMKQLIEYHLMSSTILKA